jgi:protoheme IX farnesyltransferase
MLPAVVSVRTTATRIFAYTVLLWALTLIFSPVAGMGPLYLGTALVLGGLFTLMSWRLVHDATAARAMRLFSYSITYITLLFGAMALDQLVRSGL